MTGFSDTVFSTGGSLNKRQVDSQSSDNDFIYPPPSGDNGPNNTILQIGSTVDLKWATTLPFTDLMLFQQLERVPDCGGCVNGPYMIAGNLSVKDYVWTVTTGSLDLSIIPTFFLIIRPTNGNESDQFGSSFLNFTTHAVSSSVSLATVTSSAIQASSSTSSDTQTILSPVTVTVGSNPTSTSSSSTSISSSASSTTTSDPNTSNTLKASPDSSTPTKSLPTSAKIGISLAAIGFLLLTLAVVYLFYARRNARSLRWPKGRAELSAQEDARLFGYGSKPRELEGDENSRAWVKGAPAGELGADIGWKEGGGVVRELEGDQGLKRDVDKVRSGVYELGEEYVSREERKKSWM